MTAAHLEPYRDSPHRHYQRHAVRYALRDATDRVFATVREWRRRSRERAELVALDDRMLRDIGLTQGEAEFLANKPFWKE